MKTGQNIQPDAIERLAKEIRIQQKKALRILMLLSGTILFAGVLIFAPQHKTAWYEQAVMMTTLTALCFGWLSMIYHIKRRLLQ